MMLQRFSIGCVIWVGMALINARPNLNAQDSSTKKLLQLPAQGANAYAPSFRLLPTEEEQEAGNAVPVLLRLVYEQTAFMRDVYPKLDEFATMDLHDPRLSELKFDHFAKQIIRAGSMSYADWEFPLRSEQPYMILLPDIQSQRQLSGRGMTAWIKQQISKGDHEAALNGIKAQLGCARHCSATPVVVCHLVGMAIANLAFDNLELAIQTENCPNMYWSLAALGPTLQDLGPTVRWELWATPARLEEPLPPVGDKHWTDIAHEFVTLFAEVSSESYTKEESDKLQKNMDQIATGDLSRIGNFSGAEIDRMSTEERIMRWIYMNYLRFRNQVEPLSYQSSRQVITAMNAIEAAHQSMLTATGAKSSPYPIALPIGILACKNFERRVKFLQTIEAIRDYASRHDGNFPSKLDELDLAAPNDPFTEQPFVYEVNDSGASLRQAVVEDVTTTRYEYELTIK